MKNYVQWALIDACPEKLAQPFKKTLFQTGKPIGGTPDARMNIYIVWGKENHGDCESIYNRRCAL